MRRLKYLGPFSGSQWGGSEISTGLQAERRANELIGTAASYVAGDLPIVGATPHSKSQLLSCLAVVVLHRCDTESMDPVSGAGLGLAILPLIISALENYEHLFQPLFIFTRDCRKEVELFQLQLQVQQTTFTNECHLILRTVAAYQYEVPEMLNEHRHILWRDRDLDTQLRFCLGESFDACVAALRLVQQTLDHAVGKYGGLEMLLTRSKVGFAPQER